MKEESGRGKRGLVQRNGFSSVNPFVVGCRSDARSGSLIHREKREKDREI